MGRRARCGGLSDGQAASHADRPHRMPAMASATSATSPATPPVPARTYQVDAAAGLADSVVQRLPRYARQLGFTRLEWLLADAGTGDDAALRAMPRLAAGCREAGLAFAAVAVTGAAGGTGATGPQAGFDFDDGSEADAASWLRAQLQRDEADRAWRFARSRAALTLAWALPGDKRVRMGAEFAQPRGPGTAGGLQWHLLADRLHEGLQRLVHDLNHLCAEWPALHSAAMQPLAWHEPAWGDDILAFVRQGAAGGSAVLAAGNLSIDDRPAYRIGVAQPGCYRERLASGLLGYGGPLTHWPQGRVDTEAVPWGGHAQSLVLRLPAFCSLLLEGPV